MKSWLKLIAGICVAGLVVAASAAEKGSKDEAIALAGKAAAFLKANGKDKAFAEFSKKDGPFVDRDMYVFVTDFNGKMLAHGANEKLVGRYLIDLKDAEGKPLARDLIAQAKSGKPGWVDYKWPNPVTRQIEAKTTYVLPIGDDMYVAVGIYK